MTFDDWINSKRPALQNIFLGVEWPAVQAFLAEVYEIGLEHGHKEGYSHGYKEGQDDYECSITRL